MWEGHDFRRYKGRTLWTECFSPKFIPWSPQNIKKFLRARLPWWDSCHKQRYQNLLSFCYGRTQEEGNRLQARKWALTWKVNLLVPWSWTSQPPETVRNRFLVFNPPHLGYSVSKKPKLRPRSRAIPSRRQDWGNLSWFRGTPKNYTWNLFIGTH